MKEIMGSVVICLILCFGDRLRQISWSTVKPIFVLFYLSHMIWSLSLLYEIFEGSIDLHQCAGLIAMTTLLVITKPNWSRGVPVAFQNNSVDQPRPDL